MFHTRQIHNEGLGESSTSSWSFSSTCVPPYARVNFGRVARSASSPSPGGGRFNPEDSGRYVCNFVLVLHVASAKKKSEQRVKMRIFFFFFSVLRTVLVICPDAQRLRFDVTDP